MFARHKTAALLLVLALPALAHAGAVTGSVTAKDASGIAPDRVVVWIEGENQPLATEDRPAISQTGAAFSPDFLVVVAGQRVSMPNDDSIAHNVFSYSAPKKFNLGIYPKGETKEVHFDQPGRVDVYCSIHRHMHATIIVVPTPHFAQTALDTPFTITDVPPGNYTLTVWADGANTVTQSIAVTENKDTAVEPITVAAAEKE